MTLDVGKLTTLTRPFRHIVKEENDNAIFIAKNSLLASNLWASITVQVKDLGLDNNNDVAVDGKSLLSVLSSLPQQEELKLELTDASLLWRCGKARGRLALIAREKAARGGPEGGRPLAAATPAFARGFALGALSCGEGSAAASLGLNRVTIFADGKQAEFVSTDNATLSHYVTESELEGKWCLTGSAAALLEELTSLGGAVGFGKNIDYVSEVLRAEVALIEPKESDVDLRKIVANYGSSDITVSLDKSAVAAFVKRAQNLAETQEHKVVDIGAEDGQIILEFKGSTSESSEYMLTNQLPKDFSCRVRVAADKVSRALSHCDKVVLDHADRKALVFIGDNFRYLISGIASK